MFGCKKAKTNHMCNKTPIKNNRIAENKFITGVFRECVRLEKKKQFYYRYKSEARGGLHRIGCYVMK